MPGSLLWNDKKSLIFWRIHLGVKQFRREIINHAAAVQNPVTDLILSLCMSDLHLFSLALVWYGSESESLPQSATHWTASKWGCFLKCIFFKHLCSGGAITDHPIIQLFIQAALVMTSTSTREESVKNSCRCDILSWCFRGLIHIVSNPVSFTLYVFSNMHNTHQDYWQGLKLNKPWRENSTLLQTST